MFSHSHKPETLDLNYSYCPFEAFNCLTLFPTTFKKMQATTSIHDNFHKTFMAPEYFDV